MIGIDFAPLIPAINGMIVAVAGIITASTPVIAYYVVVWLRNHGIAASQAAMSVIVDRVNATIVNGQKYATTAADDGINKLTINVSDPTVAKAANYAIMQSPDLFKKLGFDVTTEEGQQAVVRMVTARSVSALPSQSQPATDINVHTEKPNP
jgi:hypothetical protein